MARRQAWPGVLALLALAAAGPTAVSKSRVQEIQEQIAAQRSGPGDIGPVVSNMEALFQEDAGIAAANLRSTWAAWLMEQGAYEEVIRMTQRGILAAPQATGQVEMLQTFRVRALLKAGRAGEALANAKSLFNVATCKGTEGALLLLAECLNAAYPERPAAGEPTRGSQLVEQFRREQRAGAAIPEGTAAPVRSAVLASIRVDERAFDPQRQLGIALSDLRHEPMELLGVGNLLLLADRPKEAAALFDRFWRTADYPNLLAAHEAVARGMRAEDGTIGRANGYLRSLKPEGK